VRKTFWNAREGERDRGYVLTGLRDTPMSSSGVFDDAGRINTIRASFGCSTAMGARVGAGRSRRWTNGGDRPIRRICSIIGVGAGKFPRVLALSQAAKGVQYGALVWHIVRQGQ